MTTKRKYKLYSISSILSIVLFFSMGLFFVRCANTMTPTGGPRDTLPPKVVFMTPNFGTTNFTQKRIVIEFNEYVQLKELQKEFFTSPLMKKKPTVTMRGRGIQVDIQDTLPENTTYALNFGASIQDNNEGNPMNGFRYVFSTGKDIDSLVMSGFTVDGYTRDSIGKTFIMFYPAEADSIKAYDSLLLKAKPVAVGRSQANGIFVVENLKPINYKIYAFEDKNNNQQYDPGADKVGFLDSLYNPIHMPDFNIWFDTTRKYLVADPQVYIRMFMDEQFKRHNLLSNKRPLQHKIELQFGAPNPIIEYLKFDGIDSSQIITEYVTQGKDTINFWLNIDKENLPDTISGVIKYMKHDSLSVLQPVTQNLKLGWKFFESKQAQKERERKEKERETAIAEGKVPEKEPNPFKYKADATTQLNPLKHISMEFDYPLSKVDTANISLIRIGEEDKMYRVKFRFEQDSALIRKWVLKAAWSPGQKYKLLIPSGALTNIAGQSNDSLRSEMTVMHPDEFATLVVNLKGKTPESKYVIQLLDQSGSMQQEERFATTGKYKFQYINPGTVKVRIIEDNNGNGIWDKGNLIERRQSERVEIFINDNAEEEIPTKVGWENEFDIDMNKLFAPMTMERLMEQIKRRDEAIERKRQKEKEKIRTKPKSNREQQNTNNNTNNNSGMGFGNAMGGIGGIGGRR